MEDGKDLERIALIDVSSEDDLLISCGVGGVEAAGHYKDCGMLVEKPAKPCTQVPVPSDSTEIKHNSSCKYNWRRSLAWDSRYKDCGMLVEKPAKPCTQVPVPSDSPEIKHNSSGKYNLRKSLAWDSAFFTNEGVLDPEELAVVNSTFRKVQIHVLPGIQEDARKSGESSTTLDSDSWAAENTEIDLFENLRASIQKFQTNYGKNPSLSHSSSTLKKGKLDVKSTGCKIDSISSSASKNAQISLQAKIKPPFAPKKHGLSGQQVVEKSNGSASHRREVKAASGSREEKPSLRPPRTASGLRIAPSRGTSISRSVHIKSKAEGIPLGNSQPVAASKKHIAGNQCNIAPRSSPSVKSSGSAKLHPTAACSSNNGSGGSLSARICKGPLESSRKKVSTNFDQSSCKSAKIYPATASKDISGTRSVNITLKFSSSISPSSSLESFASESSSSSTSTARKPISSTGSLDCGSSPCLRVAAYNAPHDNAGAKSLKPSGLRLPSPKIGYFDAEKSLAHSANKSSQRCPQACLTRNPSKLNNNGGPVQKQKSGKDQLASSENSSSYDSEFANPSLTGSSSSLLQVKSSHNVSDNVRKSQNHCEKCPNSQESSCNSQNITLKANNVGTETPHGCQLSTPSIEESKCQDQFQSLDNKAATSGDELIIPGEGTQEVREIAGKSVEGLSSCILQIQDGFMENKWHTISNHDEKENALPSEDHMNATSHT